MDGNMASATLAQLMIEVQRLGARLFRLYGCGQRLLDEFHPHCSLDFGCHI